MKVMVDRKTWLRGEGEPDSCLVRRRDGRMCCLGFACEALGVPREILIGVSSPLKVRARLVNNSEVLNVFLLETSDHTFQNNKVTDDLMRANDSVELTDTRREAIITRLGVELGLEFEFVG